VSDTKLTAMMTDDCLHDPVLGAKVLLGVKRIPPNQEARLWAMWTKPMFIDSSGFGTGKSMNMAMIAALRSMLIPDRVSGVLGANFNQGKLIHNYFDEWIERNPIFRNQVKLMRDGKPWSTHLQDAWMVRFRNGSVIRTIPPDFLRGAERVASESWTDGYFEEWTRYPNFKAFFKVILGRVRKPVDYEHFDSESSVFTNHICFFGTASYKWNPAWPVVKEFRAIKSGDVEPPPGVSKTEYDYQSWNYKDYPPAFRNLLNLKVIRMMENQNTKADVKMEVMGKWQDDTAGLYSMQDIRNARSSEVKIANVSV